MTASPFTVTSTGSLAVEAGQEGTISFSITSLAAPDKQHEMTLRALLVADDGTGKEVDWLAVGSGTLSLTGGQTATVALTVRPIAASPPGKATIKLAIADRDRPEDVYSDSPTVTCEIVASRSAAPPAITPPAITPPATPPLATTPPATPLRAITPVSRRVSWRVIAMIAGGALVAILGVVLLVWKLRSGPEPTTTVPIALGEACGSDPARECDKGLICAAAAKKCLLASGASCKRAQPTLCASGECESASELCAIPRDGACDPDDKVPCTKGNTCERSTKTCVKTPVGALVAACKAGDKPKCSTGTSLDTCGSDGTWKTTRCPASAALCNDGKCQCSANKGKACNCGGTIQCNGTCSTSACSGTCTNGRCCLFSSDPGCGQTSPLRKKDFNSYILRAIDTLHQTWGAKGYSAGTAYTHNLDYSMPGEIKAGPFAPKTMCVAAVSEVVIAALKLYADETGDRTVFIKLPGISWIKGTTESIRAYMFLYDNVDSNGTADALKHFGIGESRPFPALIPGDFIGLNRENRSGHAVVFMGFLNAKGEIEPQYDSKKVVGFKYFSSQGSGPGSGLGYRWAFFGNCPSWRDPAKLRDCGIVQSNNQAILNTGYMWHPSLWDTATAKRVLKAKLIDKKSDVILTRKLGLPPTVFNKRFLKPLELRKLKEEAKVEVDREAEIELPPTSRLKFDGATTDN